MKECSLYSRVILVCFCVCVGLPGQRALAIDRKLFNGIASGKGLYSSTDHITILDGGSFDKSVVMNQNKAWIVEFYYSWCGDSILFASTWENLALNIYSWRDIVEVAAIDCANKVNKQLCRNYVVTSYPTLRYFPPNSSSEFKGDELKLEHSVKDLRHEVIAAIEKTVSDEKAAASWPNLKKTSNLNETLSNLAPEVKFVAMVFEHTKSYTGTELILDFHGTRELKVFSVEETNMEYVKKYDIQTFPSLFIQQRGSSFTHLSVTNTTREAFSAAVKRFIETQGNHVEDLKHAEKKAEHVTLKPTDKSVFDKEKLSTFFDAVKHFFQNHVHLDKDSKHTDENVIRVNTNHISNSSSEAETSSGFLTAVKRFLKHHVKHVEDAKHDENALRMNPKQSLDSNNETGVDETVHQLDLEMALRYILFQELRLRKIFDGEILFALKTFLRAIARYFPLDSAGKLVLHEFTSTIYEHDGLLTIDQYNDYLKPFEAQMSRYLLNPSGYFNCAGSTDKQACSLWLLFHTLTVQAHLKQHKYSDSKPQDVLNSVQGYVKYFFSSTEYAQNYESIAVFMPSYVDSFDKSILWSWKTHNEVNARLANSFVPGRPKIQFPSRVNCPTCYRDDRWVETEVLVYLKRIYGKTRHDPLLTLAATKSEILNPASARSDAVSNKRAITPFIFICYAAFYFILRP